MAGWSSSSKYLLHVLFLESALLQYSQHKLQPTNGSHQEWLKKKKKKGLAPDTTM